MSTGTGSSFPIMRLAAKYNEARKNGQLLSNRHAVNIIDDRIVQLAERVDVGEAPERVKALYELWKEYQGYLDRENIAKSLETRLRIDTEFEKIYHDYMAWSQIFEALDLRRKMIESEVKVLKDIKGIISVEDAYQLVAKMLAAMQRVLGDDPRKMKQVQYEFSNIIGESSDSVGKGIVEADGGNSGEESSQ